jgi:hypothetical protein
MRQAVRRVGWIAWHTLDEACRLRLAWLALAGAAGATLLAGEFRVFELGSAEFAFWAECGWGAIGLASWVGAAVVTPALFFRELGEGGAGLVLTRAAARAEFVLGKIAGVAAGLALFILGLGGALTVFLFWRGGSGSNGLLAAATARAALLLWGKSVVVTALGAFVCSQARTPVFAAGATLLLAGAGHLRAFADGAAGSFLTRAVPNLAFFAGELDGAGTRGLGQIAAYGLAYALVYAVLACHGYRRREF